MNMRRHLFLLPARSSRSWSACRPFPAGRAPQTAAGTGLGAGGIINDPFTFYYAIYLPNQQLQSMRPGPLDAVNGAMAQRQYYAQMDRRPLYNPISPYADKYDPLHPYSQQGQERIAHTSRFMQDPRTPTERALPSTTIESTSTSLTSRRGRPEGRMRTPPAAEAEGARVEAEAEVEAVAWAAWVAAWAAWVVAWVAAWAAACSRGQLRRPGQLIPSPALDFESNDWTPVLVSRRLDSIGADFAAWNPDRSSVRRNDPEG